MNAPVETPEKPAVLDMHGSVLTVSVLKVIAEAIETHGQITVINCATHSDQAMTQWLDLVIKNLQTRKTKGRDNDGR